ncbi:tmem17a, partial [Symbiodinium sp. KB8]
VDGIDMNPIMKFIVPIFSGIWVLVEAIRLWLGFSGNLRERVPELAAFVLLTVFPQIPIMLLLGFIAVDRVPADAVTAAPQLVFLLLEAVVSFRTVRALMRKQTAEFFRACQTDVEGAARAGAVSAADEGPGTPASWQSHAGSDRTPLPDGVLDHGGEPSIGDVASAAGTGLSRTLFPAERRGSRSELLKED